MSNGGKSKVQASIDAAMEARRKALYKKRLEIASQGFKDYKSQELIEAVKSFESYIRILEEWKGTSSGGLKISHFDQEKEKAEIVLLSGVYWDLAKLYDRTTNPLKQKMFRHYLQQHVHFSLGTEVEGVAAEGMRKYIHFGNPVHRENFKQAYEQLSRGRKCFVATALSDFSTDPLTLPRLRAWRDQSLQRHLLGRIFVSLYYRVGPTLARGVLYLPAWMRRTLARALDRFARGVSSSLLLSNSGDGLRREGCDRFGKPQAK